MSPGIENRVPLGLGFVTMIFLPDSWLPARDAVM